MIVSNDGGGRDVHEGEADNLTRVDFCGIECTGEQAADSLPRASDRTRYTRACSGARDL